MVLYMFLYPFFFFVNLRDSLLLVIAFGASLRFQLV